MSVIALVSANRDTWPSPPWDPSMAATAKDIANIASSEHYKRLNGLSRDKPLDIRAAMSTKKGKARAKALMKKYHLPD
jgi:hypothetical protein